MQKTSFDYARRDWWCKQHRARYRKRVEGRVPPLVCQECGGSGGEVVPVFMDQGPFEECGWCGGTGLMDSWRRGEWLRWKRSLLTEGKNEAMPG